MDAAAIAAPGDSVEIVVTPTMVAAGLDEMSRHSYGEEISYVLECVFRAMAYKGNDFACSKTEVKCSTIRKAAS